MSINAVVDLLIPGRRYFLKFEQGPTLLTREGRREPAGGRGELHFAVAAAATPDSADLQVKLRSFGFTGACTRLAPGVCSGQFIFSAGRGAVRHEHDKWWLVFEAVEGEFVYDFLEQEFLRTTPVDAHKRTQYSPPSLASPK